MVELPHCIVSSMELQEIL